MENKTEVKQENLELHMIRLCGYTIYTKELKAWERKSPKTI